MNTGWVVKVTINGVQKEQQYTPYDSYGMTSMIMSGLKEGTVTINGHEVVDDGDGYYKLVDETVDLSIEVK